MTEKGDVMIFYVLDHDLYQQLIFGRRLTFNYKKLFLIFILSIALCNIIIAHSYTHTSLTIEI